MDLAATFSELIILTASRTLMGAVCCMRSHCLRALFREDSYSVAVRLWTSDWQGPPKPSARGCEHQP